MVKHIKSRIAIDTSDNTHKKLKDIPRGETFSHFGHSWVVLEHDDTNHTLVITKDIIGNMPFDENNSNNWAKSTLREYLNSDFLEEMCVGLPPANLGFSLFKTDLTADDGLKDYGRSLDIISLLTCGLYRKHREILKPIDKWWWLATPYSTLADYSCHVRYVCTGGALNCDYAYNRHWGVRPICYLSSKIFV